MKTLAAAAVLAARASPSRASLSRYRWSRRRARSDREYAANVDSGSRWLLGRLLVPATVAKPDEHELRVARGFAEHTAVAELT